ncbi:Enoyl-[acyl-carrier-protein] reductase [NADH] FabI [Alcanivorax sp. ALC70]|nr:Enoyl-[acyl-carrier-protein] reductase [NADH] FabI [Alcanivorax sp. ALC70]
MGFLAGKRFLIVGIASDRSIATGIAEAMHREGAELAFTYQNDKLKSRVVKAAERYGGNEALCFPCDVTSDDQIQQVFSDLGKQWDGLDGVVHAVGFAPPTSWTATSRTWPPGKASAWPTTSPPTASWPWPRRPGP